MAAFLTPLIVYVPPFYAGTLGLGLGSVGLIFALAKLWDIVTDPMVGPLVDRIRLPLGRRRPWILVSLPIMMLGTYKIFVPPEAVGGAYFAGWLLFLYVGWTLLTISHISWGIELSDEYHERSRIAAYRQTAALLGSLAVAFIPVIVDLASGVSERGRMSGIGLFIVVSLPVMTAFVFWSTGESLTTPAAVQKRGLRGSLLPIARNRPLGALLAANMAMLIGSGATSSILLFYSERVLLLGEWATFAIVPLLFAGLLFLPAWLAVSRRYGKHRALAAAMLVQLLVLPLLLWLPSQNLLLAIVVFLLVGANNGTIVFLPQAMIGDIADVEVAAGGPRRTGLYVALLQSTSKLSGALGVALTYAVVARVGFDPAPDVVNSPQALAGLRYVIVLFPGALYLLGFLAICLYTLDEARHAQLRAATSK